jgi:hypothetical protein
VKETHVFEADTQVGVDGVRSWLKENEHVLSNRESQAETGRYMYNRNQGELR